LVSAVGELSLAVEEPCNGSSLPGMVVSSNNFVVCHQNEQ
jgi:hypothetical protein